MMSHGFKVAILIAAMAVSPAIAEPADPHADHHPAAESKSSPQPAADEVHRPGRQHGRDHCPMMKNHMGGKSEMMGMGGADDGAKADARPSGGMMGHCMVGKARDRVGPGDGHEHD